MFLQVSLVMPKFVHTYVRVIRSTIWTSRVYGLCTLRAVLCSPLLAMQWKGKVSVDTALPSGLPFGSQRSLMLLRMHERYVKEEGARFFWYCLNDFIIVDRVGTGEWTFNNEVLHHTYVQTPIPTRHREMWRLNNISRHWGGYTSNRTTPA